MEGPWFRLLLGLLATWRIAHLLVHEDGPWDILVRWRVALGQRALGHLMDCFHCVSLWAAVPFAPMLGQQPLEWVLAWLGLSGGACLLERLGHQPLVMQPLPTEGEDHELLRRKTDGAAEDASGPHGP